MSKPVRVRFAPSPTGPLHIGGVRTALFNYLFAKKHQGTFYLRIEDTDQTRYVSGAENYIFEALNWLGIAPDETVDKNEKFGPYRQSERQHIYKQYADELIAKGWAYYAFDSALSLDEHRKNHEAQGKTFIYNWHNREKLDNSLTISSDELNERLANNEAYVIRFKSPKDETLLLNDIIRGEIKVDTNLLDDKVLFKSDGMPTYHLANIVDDHLMETSHVIRGEEWLPSLALHVLLYRAFEWEAPQFAHLPLILKPEGNGKLSKRDGDKFGFPIFPLNWQSDEGVSIGYREAGYFPEAVINFLALLGWNDGTDQELFSLEELIEKFDLTRVHKAGAKFDFKKNTWFNHQYLQRKYIEDLVEIFIPLLDIKLEKKIIRNESLIFVGSINRSVLNDKNKIINYNSKDYYYVYRVLKLVRHYSNFYTEFWDNSSFFFVAPKNFNENSISKINQTSIELLEKLISVLEAIQDFNNTYLVSEITDFLREENINTGKLMQPLRIALIGSLKGPDLYYSMEILGKNETIKRLDFFIKTFKNA